MFIQSMFLPMVLISSRFPPDCGFQRNTEATATCEIQANTPCRGLGASASGSSAGGQGAQLTRQLEGRVSELERQLKAQEPRWPDLEDVFDQFLDDIECVGFGEDEVQCLLDGCRSGVALPLQVDDSLVDLFLRSLLSCLKEHLPLQLQACLSAVQV